MAEAGLERKKNGTEEVQRQAGKLRYAKGNPKALQRGTEIH